MKYLLSFSCFFVFGCSTLPKDKISSVEYSEKPAAQNNIDFNYQSFMNALDSTNQKMRGELYREMKKDLSSLRREKYKSKLESYQSSNAKSTKKDLKKFEVIKIVGYEKTFVMCAYSSELEFSFCDDPMCMNIEKHEYSKVDKTDELTSGLPLNSCEAK